MPIETPLPLFDTLENHSLLNVPEYPWLLPDDYRYAAIFLQSYRGSHATFNAYRRELERYIQWCGLVVKKHLRDIKREDIETFIEFCQSPPRKWISTKKSPRFIDKEGQRIPNSEWKPFSVTVSKTQHQEGRSPDPKNYKLSQKATQAIFAVLSSFYNYLIQEEYASLNPVATIRQKSKFMRKEQQIRIIRKLSELQWSYVLETVKKLADERPDKHERSLFIMNALYAMYLRISELVSSARWDVKMGDFYRDDEERWWFRTVGKGNKQRDIAVSDAMLASLKRYRSALGLTPLPPPGDTTPLISKVRGTGPVSSTRQIRKIVQKCFDLSIGQLVKDGFSEDADHLRAATVHWLRHTGISDDIKHRPREHVRDDAGHSSSAITDLYIDIELRERHASGKEKRIHPDENP